MKKLIYFAAALLVSLTSCEKNVTPAADTDAYVGEGILKVNLAYEVSPESKAQTDYTEVLDAEKAEKSVSVLVFDKASGQLNVSKSLSKTSDAFSATVPAGEKTVYAVVNGPDLSQITTISQLTAMTDDLANTNLAANGLTMIGSADCTVTADAPATASITVKRMVGRVVVEKITNKLPEQYGSMTIDAIYLGNANTVQTFAGASSVLANPSGYADANMTQPIGKNSVTGACVDYLYRGLATNILCNESNTDKQYLYCQPNSTSPLTTVYILATIGGIQYYYNIPLTGTVKANYTYSIKATISNLGTDKPDGTLVKGTINASIIVAGWAAGEDYNTEF